MVQSTQSVFESARSYATQWFRIAYDDEASARSYVATCQTNTAKAIYTARLVGLSWVAICDHLGGMGRSSAYRRLIKAKLHPPTPDKNATCQAHTHARVMLDRAWNTEQTAHKALREAVNTTAAIITLARLSGHTWSSLSTITGMTRKAQLDRLATTYNTSGYTVPTTAKLAIVTDTEFQEAGHNLHGQTAVFWKTPAVEEAVIQGVAIAVSTRLATWLNNTNHAHHHNPFNVLSDLEKTRKNAIQAAIASLDAIHQPGSSFTDDDLVTTAARTALYAATATGKLPTPYQPSC